MNDLVARLASLPSQNWWVHEKVVCRKLGFKHKEGLSVRTQLQNLLTAIKKGGRHNHVGEWESTGRSVMDLHDSSVQNELGVLFALHGTNEEFKADRIGGKSQFKPRYFYFGNRTTNAISVGSQLKIMRNVTGKTGSVNEDQERRAAIWRAWYEGDKWK
jgi:hypothetical protein